MIDAAIAIRTGWTFETIRGCDPEDYAALVKVLSDTGESADA